LSDRAQRLQAAEDCRRRLGQELKAIRTAAGMTTRQIDGYSSGHISNVEGGKVMPSEKLVLAYAALGGSHAQLLALLRQAQVPRRPDPVVAEALSDPHADPHLLRRGYVVEMIEDVHYFGDQRQPLRNLHRLTARFTTPGARFFPFRHTIDEDARRGVSQVLPVDGCDIALLEESDDGVIYCVLEVDPAARDDLGRSTFSWNIELRTDVVGRPRADAGSTSRIPLVTKRVQFDGSAPPAEVWWFRGFDVLGASMSDARQNSIPPNPALLFTHEFINVENEWWGLAWTWRENADRRSAGAG
jgi:transcriptional regulator with XRE-family HTH domain